MALSIIDRLGPSPWDLPMVLGKEGNCQLSIRDNEENDLRGNQSLAHSIHDYVLASSWLILSFYHSLFDG